MKARSAHAFEHEGHDDAGAFLSGMIHTMEFCAGSVMTCFLLASRRGPEGDQIKLPEVESMFRGIVEKAVGFVCHNLPNQLTVIDDILAREKKSDP
jgi:hypothetical protein